MKIKSFLRNSFLFLILFSGTITTFSQITTGTYTIGATGDYATLNAAVTALTTNGVAGDGPVVFKIKSATYDEQIILGTITGTSASSAVTFQSESGNAEDVLIQNSGNYIISLNGGDYITFRKLKFYNYSTGSYSRIVYSNSVSSNITFNNCKFFGRNFSSTSNTFAHIFFNNLAELDYFTVDSCTFTDGTFPVYIYNTSAISNNMSFKYNTVNTQCGFYIYKGDKVQFKGNTINTPNYAYCIWLDYCNDNIEITNNKAFTNYTSTIYAISVDHSTGSFVYPGLIANNFVQIEGSTSSQVCGISIYYSSYQKVFNNTVNITKGNNNSYCLFNDNGSNLTIKNNLLFNDGLGYALGTNVTANITSDYNNLYSAGNYLVRWGSSYPKDLDAYKTFSQDANSISVWPSFVSSTNLHVKSHWLNNKGTSLTEVTTDIDGQSRGANPDIGADEFTPADEMSYAGLLIIDKTGGGDFTSFTQALDSLILHGISDNLTIEVADGIYNEHIVVHEIPGSGSSKKITFVSSSSDSTKVTLTFGGTSDADNYVVCFWGGDYVTFKQLTFSPSGSTYGKAIGFFGYCHDIQILNNLFNGSGGPYDFDQRTLIACNYYRTDNLTIQNNKMLNGSRGIRLQGISTSDNSSGILIKGNLCSGTYRNVNIENCTNAEISFNECTDFTNAGIGVYNCQNPVTASSNKIYSTYLTSNGNGIYFNGCNGISGGMIANNFIGFNTGYSPNGIYFENSQYHKIYYNSVYILGSGTSTYGFYNYSGSNLTVKNNNFVISGPGFAYYNKNSAGISASDYNNMYTVGTYIGCWGTTNTQSLSDFQTASSTDAHSKNVNPVFISNTNLHTNSYWIDNAGTPVEVTTDIDGETRSGSTPDIGADEYSSTNTPLSGTYTIGSGGTYTTLSAAVTDLAVKGILGSVTFNILAGTYNEQVSISQITGASAQDTVVFQSETGNPDDVMITYDGGSSNNYIISLDGADHVTIRNLKFEASNSQYAHIIVMNGSSLYNTFSGNKFQGRINGSTGSEDAIIYAADNGPIIHHTTISNNIMNGGSFSIFLNSNTTNTSQNLKILNNTCYSYYQNICLTYFTAPTLQGNNCKYYTTDGSGVGLNIQYCGSSSTAGMIILANEVNSDESANYYGGIYIRYCDASGSKPGLIANNTVSISSSGKSPSQGIQINDSDNLNIYYNSVNITCDNFNDKAFYSTASNYLNISNNIFAIRGELGNNRTGSGYAFFINSGNNITSNYNNYYSPGRFPFCWIGTYCQTLDELRSASGKDANSQAYYPAFYSYTNLRPKSPWMNGKGIVTATVATDKSGNARDGSTPDLGAYEFSTTLNPFAGGTLTMGSTGNIPSFDSLGNYLMTVGITGPTTINVLNGIYFSTHVILKDIPGVNATDTLVIQSNSGNPSTCTLGYSQTSSDNYIFFLNGTDYITFRNFTFSSGGTNYSSVFLINGNSKHVNILNNTFTGYASTTTDYSTSSTIYAYLDHITDYLTISGNTFNNNSYGVNLNGYTSYNNKKIEILNNIFNNQYIGIYMGYVYNPLIKNNQFNNNCSRSIYLYYCDESVKIIGNKIQTLYENNGIQLYSCDGTALKMGLIANNFVKVGNTNTSAYGMKIEYCTNHNYYNNSVTIYGATSCYFYGGGSNMVVNNILVNKKSSQAFYVYNSGVAYSDYNDFYSAGTTLISYNNTNYSTLAQYQTAVGRDINSKNILPDFTSSSDLHLTSETLMGYAAPLAEITIDIDGNPRDASTPDIGADELYCTAPVLSVPDITVCQFEDVVVNNQSTGLAAVSYFYWDFNGNGTNDDTTTSVSAPVNYAFQQFGNFTAKLTAYQLGGCENFINFSVTVNAKPSMPTASNVNGCSGSSIPDLTASGQNLVWYSNPDLTTQVHTGETFPSGQTTAGVYNYYVTQSINNCASDARMVVLTIYNPPAPPVVQDTAICFGQTTPTLNASGTNIKWYAENTLNTLLASTSSYTPSVTSVGYYSYFVTQQTNNCTSNYDSVSFTIKPLPELNVAGATVCQFELISATVQATGLVNGAIFYWDFNGDGTNDDTTYSPSEAAHYTFQQFGNYTAELNLYQPTDCDNNTTFLITVNPRPNPPVANDITSCSNDETPDLTATGQNILWFSNPELTTQVFAGDSFPSGQTAAGTYTYYATQTVLECRSNADIAVLTIVQSPEPPAAENVEICFGESSPTLSATGTNIKWYADGALTTLLISSDEYNPGVTAVGNYSYYVTQTDGNCMSAATVVTLIIHPTPQLSAQITNIDCESHPFGTIDITVTGGTIPYFFNWSNGKTSEDITNLATGLYSVTISDFYHCGVTHIYTITEPYPLILNMITNDADCGEHNGSATVSVTGGQEPYDFRWNTGDSLPTIDSLYSGIYVVTVTDQLSCYKSAIATINDLGGPVITVNTVQNVSCYGLSDGAISLTITGGVPPFKIEWSNGATTEDINGLQAGPYEIQVMDADSCKSVKSILVTQPAPINILLSVLEASCNQANGSASATVSGGTQPYTYLWSNGASTTSISNLALGVYHLTITDNNTCQAIKSFGVSELGAPSVVIDSIIQGTCGNTDGAIYISAYGTSVDLTYSWSNGTFNQDLVGVNPGDYSVTVTDPSTCAAIQVASIVADQPPYNPICLVTVDSATSHNQVVWEKVVTENIATYNIYRESTQSGVYLLMGSQPVSELSIFTDTVSNSQQRSYRYKMSTTDICNVESELSPHHKTMHLTINLGLNNTINLIWDHYEGFNFSSYYIYRYSGGTWHILDSISNNLTSFTDLTPPTGLLYYQIEVHHPYGCEATKAVNKNTSRSNVSSITGGTNIVINKNQTDIEQLGIYPNPNSGSFHLSAKFYKPTRAKLIIYNMLGKIIYTTEWIGNENLNIIDINIAGIQSGLYMMNVQTRKQSLMKPFVVQ